MSAPQRALSGPEIRDLPALDLIGLERRYDADPLAGIPGQWQQFTEHLAGLRPGPGIVAYGVVSNAGPSMAAVTYLCALPGQSGLAEAPGLVRRRLPALRLAAFALRGHISAIRAATQAIFAEHLPAAGLRPAGGVDLIEVYGPEFDPATGFGEVGLWVPLAP